MISQVVHSEHDGQRTHHWIFGVLRADQHGYESGLPIVDVHHVWQPDALHKLDGDAGEFAEALGVVRIISALLAVELLAVKVAWIVDKEVAHAANTGGFGDGGKRILSPKVTVTLEIIVEVMRLPR